MYLSNHAPKGADYRGVLHGRVNTILEHNNKDWKKRYRSLVECLNHKNPAVVDRAAKTLAVMENQQMFIEKLIKDKMLESTFTGNLGQLIPKLIDVVRIFYPNLIAQDLVDIQPLDRQTGQIFMMRPVYTNTAAGVAAGDQMFMNVTDGTYASENILEVLGTGDGTLTAFTGTASNTPVRVGTFTVNLNGVEQARDDGAGNLVGAGGSGTVDYGTGAVAFTFTTAPATGQNIVISYRYSSEASGDLIRSVDIKMTTLPVMAEPHPLRVRWSTEAQLAASAHLDVDIPDVLSNVVASFIKQERDILLINRILTSAATDTNLNFDATPPAGYSRLARYAEFENKLNYAESQIQTTMGRGGVSFLFGGTNVADIARHCSSFEPSDVVAPVGPHKIGTLRDGAVSVIKVPSMNPNSYVVGFKGYVVGDSATILAEWVPLYATPVWQSPDLNNHQGLMSLYAMVTNESGYYKRGIVSGYTA